MLWAPALTPYAYRYLVKNCKKKKLHTYSAGKFVRLLVDTDPHHGSYNNIYIYLHSVIYLHLAYEDC
jgi:hypothetical protein